MSELPGSAIKVPAPPYVRAMSPYQPGKPISEVARELGLQEADIVKLASNENPLGASPKALQAMESALMNIARYPDGNGYVLKQALSRFHNVSPDSLILGNGSNDVLELASIAFLAPGTSAVYAEHCFVVNRLATQARGARGIEVPARAFGHDLDAMLAAIQDDTRVVFISNPNNPTGTFLHPDEIKSFLGQVPARVLVVLDEAYYEYLPQEMQSGSIGWIPVYPNLLVTRTFSKAHGLASLRVGYGVAHPEVSDLMNRIRQPFNVNDLAQAAAVGALDDDAFLERSTALNRVGLEQLTSGFEKMGLSWIPTWGNFVTVRVGDGALVFRKLLEQGVIVRPIGGYGLPEHVRVSVGLESENARFLDALAATLRIT